MTPEESNILRYLEGKDYASTHQLAMRFRKRISAIELDLRSMLSHGHVEMDALQYYRISAKGRIDLVDFDRHWKITPFDGKRRYA